MRRWVGILVLGVATSAGAVTVAGGGPKNTDCLVELMAVVSGGMESDVRHVPAIQDACLACHDGPDVAAHAETNTTSSGAEACGVCHGEGAAEPVSVVHAR